MPITTRIFALAIVALVCAWTEVSIAAAGQAGEAITAARQARGQSEAASAGRGQTPRAPATQPGQPAPTTPPGQPAPATPAPPAEPLGFTYNPEGRRDPFVSLLRRGGATAAGGGSNAARPPGLAGLGVNEVTLRGTVQSRDGFVAILQGSDQKTYIVRPGDKLLDGSVRTITQNDMVFVQEVNDPLSLEKQREVRKVLRQIEGQN